ncbi:hypothetical protein PHYC_01445 [Phycisphaerales bacterium]|nr:hypothetical protein PHYC_01445 [Phycisphaerales bacterium]
MRLREVVFESLESRTVLDGSVLPFVAYFPEGFAADNINEYVPITNPNAAQVKFELHARYEWGERDQLIYAGELPPNSRDGVTICETTRPDDTLVRKSVPYALILRSSLPVSATLSHYDFGTAVGESFTTTTNLRWSFADGLKSSALSRDYILVFNPNAVATNVTLTLYGTDGEIMQRSLTVSPERRAGWSIEDIPGMPTGVFAATVVADQPVVASQSHYELQTQRGYGLLGTPGGGQTAGVITSIDYDDSFYDTNGEGPGNPTHFQADSFISFLNTGDILAVVNLSFFTNTPGPDPQPSDRVVLVNPHSRATFAVRDQGLPQGTEYGVLYRSPVPITVMGAIYQGQDGTGVNAQVFGATVWDFGEGFMSRNRAGGRVQEDIYLFNPTADVVDVSMIFYFLDGTTFTINMSIESLGFENVTVHEVAEIVNHGASSYYGVRIAGSSPIVTSLEHWDGSIGGGFSTFGMMSGSVANLIDLLPQ